MSGSHKRLKADAGIAFGETRSGELVAMQTISDLDVLYETVPETEDRFSGLGKALEEIVDGQFILGPTKERKTAEEKIDRDYDGRAALISDVVRAKFVIDSPQAIQDLLKILDPQSDNNLLMLQGIQCVQMSNHFAKPKRETGYRCINAKLALPIEGTNEKHIVELQIVHKALETIYHKTHEHMRRAQEITARYKDQEIPNSAAIKRYGHYCVCKFYNGSLSKEGGLDVLLDDKKDALSRYEAKSLNNMIRSQRLEFF